MLNRAGIAFGLVFLASGAGLVCYAPPESDPVPSILAFLGAALLLEGAAIIVLVLKNWWSCVKFELVRECPARHMVTYDLSDASPVLSDYENCGQHGVISQHSMRA
ncbi:MAG: hypothetical protein ACRD8A_16655 [Candidatus Acidiferrales bacterium]